jgi:SulP family sulfate permease
MAQATAIVTGQASLAPEDDVDDFARPADRSLTGPAQRWNLPVGVEVFQFRGPLFFGAASSLTEAFDGMGRAPRVLILRMRETPIVDATGARMLIGFVRGCASGGTAVLFAGLQSQPAQTLTDMGLFGGAVIPERLVDYPTALARAAVLIERRRDPEFAAETASG